MTPLAKAQTVALAALQGVAGVSVSLGTSEFTAVISDGTTAGAPWEAKPGIDSAIYVDRAALESIPPIGSVLESGGKRFRIAKVQDLPADPHVVFFCRVSDA